jgi:hypothetical protein
MVVGSKAEDELLSMTREEVEKELLKMPAHHAHQGVHLAKTEAEWVAMEKQLHYKCITTAHLPAHQAGQHTLLHCLHLHRPDKLLNNSTLRVDRTAQSIAAPSVVIKWKRTGRRGGRITYRACARYDELCHDMGVIGGCSR